MIGMLAQPNAVDNALKGLGYLGNLSQEDIRSLQETKIPLWMPLAVGIVVGIGGTVWVQSKFRLIRSMS